MPHRLATTDRPEVGSVPTRSRLYRVLGVALLLGASVAGPAQAQTLPQQPVSFPIIRDAEDLSLPPDRAAPRQPLDGLRRLHPFGEQGPVVTIGGELRERYENYHNEGYGLIGPPRDDYVLQRALLFADVRLDPHWRAFVMLGDERAFGKREPLSPVDEDHADLTQAFVEWNGKVGATPIGVRVGRQELLVGSGRFIDIREGPNARQSHDGVRAWFGLRGGGRLDLWVVQPVLTERDVFNDVRDRKQLFSAAYLALPLIPAEAGPVHPGPPPAPVLGLDLYVIERDTRRDLARLQPEAHRQTFGARLYGARHGWDYDVEALLQTGRTDGHDILAGGAAAKAGYTFRNIPLSPRLGVSADSFTGDRHPGGDLNTVDPLYPRGGYFSEPGLQTFVNIVDVYPRLTLNPLPTVAIDLGADFIWRATTQDAVYVAPDIPLPGTAGQPGRYTGTSYTAQASWTATSYLSLNASYVHADAGRAIRAAGGGDVDYVAFWAQFRF